MSTIELRNRLIERIQITEDDQLLEEVSKLLNLDFEDSEVYILNNDQTKAIEESRTQILNGDYLTDEESNKEIDEWLKK